MRDERERDRDRMCKRETEMASGQGDQLWIVKPNRGRVESKRSLRDEREEYDVDEEE